MKQDTEQGALLHGECNLSWSVTGDGAPVVLIQGMGVGGGGWRPQTDTLSSHFRCMTFDNRGFGASQPRGPALSIARLADDVMALMDAREWQSAHLVGHSMGGLIALQAALSNPTRVRSLALLCTFADGRIPTGFTPRVVWIGMRSRMGTRRMRRNAFLELVMPRSVLAREDRQVMAQNISTLFGHDLADQPPIVMQQFGATRKKDVTSQLGNLARIPTLVVSAAEDIIAPPHAGRSIANGIPGARYVEIDGAAHGVTIQKAEAINALLYEHISKAEADDKSSKREH